MTCVGVDPHGCCGFLGCPGPWGVVEERLHLYGRAGSHDAHVSTLRDVMKMDCTVVVHVLNVS